MTVAEVPAKGLGVFLRMLLVIGAVIVAGILVWQGITASGAPDPEAAGSSRLVVALDIAVLVFREGLECVLVLSAITASMRGEDEHYRKPVLSGAAVAFVATIFTWFIAVGILANLQDSVSALNLQVITGLLAIVVLMIVMNWFFHKIYWGGWISMHNRLKKELLGGAVGAKASQSKLLWGLGLLGFTSLYREGFEVVLFLQSYNLKMGGAVVLAGALIGLFLTGIVAAINFVAHKKLPYRKMLVVTGVMLGVVFLVMVGEQAQEMQLAHWIPTTTIPALEKLIPDWMGLWFSLFPTVETIAAQAVAAAVVVGSYVACRVLARRQMADSPEDELVKET